MRMRALYDVGFDIAKTGRPWSNSPPGIGALGGEESRGISGDRD